MIELNKAFQTNDQLVVSGALTYGGTLSVTNLSGTLVAGDTFQLFKAGLFIGSFSSNDLPSLSDGLAWSISGLSDGFISVVSTIPTNLVWAVNGATLSISWPTGYRGWRLQVQTNDLSKGLGTNWFDVPGSTTTNNISTPIDPLNGSVFYRMIYP